MDGEIQLLRHTLATLAYRGGKVLLAPAEFADYKSAPDSRTPAEIMAHIGDLLDWALGMCDGVQRWQNSASQTWPESRTRFFTGITALDNRLATGAPLGVPAAKIFQGPIADAFTHIGQVAMLRRMAGCKMPGENYFVAKIAIGNVGPDQAAPVREF